MSEVEKRALLCEVRAEETEEGQPARIVGHGAVFNKRSDMILGMFKEEIAPGAFDDVLGDDVRALFNHDRNFVLASDNILSERDPEKTVWRTWPAGDGGATQGCG